MKIAVAQTRAVIGDIGANVASHLELIELAVACGGAQFIAFPELSLTGYEPRLAKELASGPKEELGEELFGFTAITPRALLGEVGEGRWGRGHLILPCFSCDEVERRLQKLLRHCSGPSWAHVANRLNLELQWEFDNYTPYEPGP
jgi:hypothetical protein